MIFLRDITDKGGERTASADGGGQCFHGAADPDCIVRLVDRFVVCDLKMTDMNSII